MKGGEGPRKIMLFCPSVSKLVQWVAWNEQRVDLGSIARAFGLEPSTVKLNGHFISRGADLVASSVTWRSLLSFLSAKGLSTGKDGMNALVVDGKLSKVGAKRAHDPQDNSGGIPYIEEAEEGGNSRSSQPQSVHKNKKLRDCNSGFWDGSPVLSISNGTGSKRKQLLEDIDCLKKLRISESSFGQSEDATERGSGCYSNNFDVPLKCSFMNGHMKRVREDEVCVCTPCKRIR